MSSKVKFYGYLESQIDKKQIVGLIRASYLIKGKNLMEIQ